MVSFGLSFISRLIKEIVEDEGVLWTKGRILCPSINISSYQVNRLQIVNGDFFPCADVSSGAASGAYGWFFGVLKQTKPKTKKTGLHAELHFSYN